MATSKRPNQGKRTPRKVIPLLVGTLLVGVLGASGPSQGAKVPGLVIAGPGAFVPFVTYLTPRVVMSRGNLAHFRNLDATLHDVISKTQGLFASPKIGLGGNTPIFGTKTLPPGTYAFRCSLHNWMTGQLIVRK